VTERDITGDARSAYKRAQRVAKNLDLTDEDMRIIAEGVREFDAQRAVEHRTAQALEKIASNTSPESSKGDSWLWEERPCAAARSTPRS
jgi:hypothetical protein